MAQLDLTVGVDVGGSIPGFSDGLKSLVSAAGGDPLLIKIKIDPASLSSARRDIESLLSTAGVKNFSNAIKNVGLSNLTSDAKAASDSVRKLTTSMQEWHKTGTTTTTKPGIDGEYAEVTKYINAITGEIKTVTETYSEEAEGIVEANTRISQSFRDSLSDAKINKSVKSLISNINTLMTSLNKFSNLPDRSAIKQYASSLRTAITGINDALSSYESSGNKFALDTSLANISTDLKGLSDGIKFLGQLNTEYARLGSIDRSIATSTGALLGGSGDSLEGLREQAQTITDGASAMRDSLNALYAAATDTSSAGINGFRAGLDGYAESFNDFNNNVEDFTRNVELYDNAMKKLVGAANISGREYRDLRRFSDAEYSKDSGASTLYANWSKAFVEFGAEYARFQETVSNGTTTQDDIGRMSAAILKLQSVSAPAKAALMQLGYGTQTFGEKVKDLFKILGTRLPIQMAVMTTIRAVKQLAKDSIEVNTAMTQMQIVTKASTKEMNDFAGSASKAAQRVGSSITDFVSSATTYARLGYNIDESSMLAEYTAMLQKVGNIDVQSAQNSVTAIVKAFSDEIDVSNIESVMDRLVEVGNNFPISVSEIATGMNNASSALSAAGNDFNQSVALLTAANTTIQDAAKSSTGLRTIAARLRKTDTELDALGESMTTAKYQDIVSQLSKYNVSLTDANGELRSTYDIMADISNIWDTLSANQQAALAETLSGTRQQAVFYSLIENFKEASGAMDAMSESAGALDSAYSTYMESTQYHIDSFKAAFQGFGADLFESGTLNSLIDFGKTIINIVSIIPKLTSLIGGMNNALGVTAGIIISLKAAKIGSFLSKSFIGDLSAFVSLVSDHGFKKAMGALNNPLKSFKSFFSELSGFGKAAFGIGTAVAAISLITGIVKKVEQAKEEARQAAASAAEELNNRNKSIEDYKAQYIQLASSIDSGTLSENEAYNAKLKLLEIQNELIKTFGKEAAGIDLVTGSIEDQKDAIEGLKVSELKDYVDSHKDALNEINKAFTQEVAQGFWESVTGTGGAFNAHLGTIEISTDLSKGYSSKLLQVMKDAGFEFAGSSTRGLSLKPISENDRIDSIYDAIEAYGKLYDAVEAYGRAEDVNVDKYLGNLSQRKRDLQDYVDANEEAFNKLGEYYAITESGYKNIYTNIVKAKQDFIKSLASGDSESAEINIGELIKFKAELDNMEGTDEFNAAADTYLEKMISDIEAESPQLFLKVKLETDIEGGKQAAKELQNNAQKWINTFKKDGKLDIITFLQAKSDVDNGTNTVAKEQREAYQSLAKYANEYGTEVQTLISTLSELRVVNTESALMFNENVDSYAEQVARMRELEKEFNSLVNGNVDYGKRPYISAEKMTASGYDGFKKGDVATLFSSTRGYTIGGVEYQMLVTPILSNGKVLTDAALDEYLSGLSGNSVEEILNSDSNKLIIDIQPGSYEETKSHFDNILDTISDIKNEHADIAMSLGIADENIVNSMSLIEDYASKLKDLKANFDGAKSSTESLISGISSINSVLSKQAQGSSISFEDFGAEGMASYKSALEYVNGAMQLNADKVKEITKTKAEEQIAYNNTQKALEQQSYISNAEKISKLRKKIEETTDATDDQISKWNQEISTLQSSNSAIEENCKKYDLLNSKIKETTGAYQAWLAAQSGSDYGEIEDNTVSAFQKVRDTLINSESEDYGYTGKNVYKTAVDLVIPDTVDKNDADAVAKYMKNLSGYFKFDPNDTTKIKGLNVQKFLDDSVKAGLMNGDSKNGWTVAGQKSAEEFAKGLNLSVDTVRAFFDELQAGGAKYNFKDEFIQTYDDIKVTALSAAEALAESGHSVSLIGANQSGLDGIVSSMQRLKSNSSASAEEIERANDVIKYCVAEKQRLNEPAIMRVDTSELEGSEKKITEWLQEYQQTLNKIEIDKALGNNNSKYYEKDLEDLKAKINKEIGNLSPEAKARLGIDEDSIDDVKEAIKKAHKENEENTPPIVQKVEVETPTVTNSSSEGYNSIRHQENITYEILDKAQRVNVDINIAGEKDATKALKKVNKAVEDAKKAAEDFKGGALEQDALDVLDYTLRLKQELNRPAVMNVDTSEASEKVQSAIALIQQYQSLSDQLEISIAKGDTSGAEEIRSQMSTIQAQISNLDTNIIATLGLDPSSEESLRNSINSITGEDLAKIGVKVDEKSLSLAAQQVKKNFVVEDKKVKVDADTTAATIKVGLLAAALALIPNEKKITITTIEETQSSSSGSSKRNRKQNENKVGGADGTAHARGTAYAGGNWGNAPGGRTLVGELGTEIVVDPRSGSWRTVGDNGAEFVNMPAGAIVFNHLQTESILKYGHIPSRGQAYASGTAMAMSDDTYIPYTPPVKWGGKSTSKSSSTKSSSKSSSSEKSEFEKQYEYHRHLVALNQETDEAYLKWLNDAYKKAYEQNQIELEDFYKYEEEVYKGLQDLFNDYLSDVEHSISLKEYYNEASDEIIDIYQNLIKEVEKEMSNAREQGLTDNDEYIQSLQDKWLSYNKSLQSIFNEQVDDIEHAISVKQNYGGQEREIIALYRKLISKVEKEIAAARRRGLSDESEYIQSLVDKWEQYNKEVKQLREDAINDAKEGLDSLVEYRIDMIEQSKNDEKDALNERLDNYRDFISKQKELLQEEHDQEKYLEDQSEKRKTVSDIERQIAQLQYDDSAWAKKKILELQDELEDAKKDLNDFEKDHALETVLDSLDKSLEIVEEDIGAEIKNIENYLDNPQRLYNQALSEITSNTYNILEEMVEYNRNHGTGNDDDVYSIWDDAYQKQYNYRTTFGENYNDWVMPDSNNTKLNVRDGMNKDMNGVWKYYKDGRVDTSYTGMAKNDYDWWYMKNGVIDYSYNGLSTNEYGTWLMQKGRLNKSYTGMYKDPSNNTWKYINQGKFDTSYTGLAKNEYGWYYMKNGVLDTSYTGMAKNKYGWWYVKNGKVDTNYTGTARNEYGVWEFVNGKLKGEASNSSKGYASGTNSAKPGIHRVNEVGAEYLFTSKDGNKYRIFTGGEKVLDAESTKFLYNFAKSKGFFAENIAASIEKLINTITVDTKKKVKRESSPVTISMGDVVVRGNADKSTISQIRRSQREMLESVLKEFNKLNR